MRKVCNKCNRALPLTSYYKRSAGADGYRGTCTTCHQAKSREWARDHPEKMRAYGKLCRDRDPLRDKARVRKWRSEHKAYDAFRVRTRRAIKLRAVPAWSDETRVLGYYEEARRSGLSVDHIVPLKHPLVCGLHCEDNLQLLTSQVNSSKGNRYWPDMPKEERRARSRCNR